MLHYVLVVQIGFGTSIVHRCATLIAAVKFRCSGSKVLRLRRPAAAVTHVIAAITSQLRDPPLRVFPLTHNKLDNNRDREIQPHRSGSPQPWFTSGRTNCPNSKSTSTLVSITVCSHDMFSNRFTHMLSLNAFRCGWRKSSFPKADRG